MSVGESHNFVFGGHQNMEIICVWIIHSQIQLKKSLKVCWLCTKINVKDQVIPIPHSFINCSSQSADMNQISAHSTRALNKICDWIFFLFNQLWTFLQTQQQTLPFIGYSVKSGCRRNPLFDILYTLYTHHLFYIPLAATLGVSILQCVPLFLHLNHYSFTRVVQCQYGFSHLCLYSCICILLFVHRLVSCHLWSIYAIHSLAPTLTCVYYSLCSSPSEVCMWLGADWVPLLWQSAG